MEHVKYVLCDVQWLNKQAPTITFYRFYYIAAVEILTNYHMIPYG